MIFPIGISFLLSSASLTAGSGHPLEEEQPLEWRWSNTTVWAELLEASPEFGSLMITHHKKMVPQIAGLLLVNRYMQILAESIRAGFDIERTSMLINPVVTSNSGYFESWIEELTDFSDAVVLFINSTVGTFHAASVNFQELHEEIMKLGQNIDLQGSTNNGTQEADEERAHLLKRTPQILEEVLEIFTITFPAHGYNIGRAVAKLVNPSCRTTSVAVQGLMLVSGLFGDLWLGSVVQDNFDFDLSSFVHAYSVL